jgi:hypothetical protein
MSETSTKNAVQEYRLWLIGRHGFKLIHDYSLCSFCFSDATEATFPERFCVMKFYQVF